MSRLQKRSQKRIADKFDECFYPVQNLLVDSATFDPDLNDMLCTEELVDEVKYANSQWHKMCNRLEKKEKYAKPTRDAVKEKFNGILEEKRLEAFNPALIDRLQFYGYDKETLDIVVVRGIVKEGYRNRKPINEICIQIVEKLGDM